MKKTLLLPIVFGLILSCGQHTAKDTISELQNDGESLSDAYMTIVKFNDALVSEQTLINIELYKIMDLDEKNVPESQFSAELDSSLAVIGKINLNLSAVDPSYSGGAALLSSMKDLSLTSKNLIQFYKDHVTVLSKDEELWTEEELDEFNTNYDIKFDAYSEAHDKFSISQEDFATLNDMILVEDSDLDAEVIYTNSSQEDTINQ
jgi:hypothetical protein